ncbi:MAG: hypothetical protein WBK20_10650 [Spirochaetota bacterium]
MILLLIAFIGVLVALVLILFYLITRRRNYEILETVKIKGSHAAIYATAEEIFQHILVVLTLSFTTVLLAQVGMLKLSSLSAALCIIMSWKALRWLRRYFFIYFKRDTSAGKVYKKK